tara:strand:+ start:10612 stop:11610 length:999 start_codon:yes stop_codon:yes gene_type:complete
MLDKLSVIVPTFNREKFSVRTANYYRFVGVKTVFGDGTTEHNDELASLGLNSKYITYHHGPGSSWSERMIKNLSSVDTEYVVISADDEFHLKTGLIKSVDMLDRDTSATCAVGRSAKFSYRTKEVKLENVYNYKNGCIGSNAIERCANLMRNYSPFPCYSVWRTNKLTQILTVLSKTDWSSWRVDEVIHVMGAGLLGNCLVHDELQWLRSDENPPSKTPTKKQIELNEWYKKPNLKNEHIHFCKVASEFMTDKFFTHYTDKDKILAAHYLLETFLFGQRHEGSLVKAKIRPQKTFEQPSINGFEFIKKNYSDDALSDFSAINKIIIQHYSNS